MSDPFGFWLVFLMPQQRVKEADRGGVASDNLPDSDQDLLPPKGESYT
jgi:hypothetical protein